MRGRAGDGPIRPATADVPTVAELRRVVLDGADGVAGALAGLRRIDATLAEQIEAVETLLEGALASDRAEAQARVDALRARLDLLEQDLASTREVLERLRVHQWGVYAQRAGRLALGLLAVAASSWAGYEADVVQLLVGLLGG